jgi:hypothetical protein
VKAPKGELKIPKDNPIGEQRRRGFRLRKVLSAVSLTEVICVTAFRSATG